MGAKIKTIKRVGVEPVYNMEVKDYHNFSVNGGLIVHNCMDATRYGHNAFAKSYGYWYGKPRAQMR